MREREGWTFLSGDVNYVEHGGRFLYKNTTMIGEDVLNRTAYVVAEWCAAPSLHDEERIYLAVRAVCPEWLDKKTYESVREFYGLEDDDLYRRLRVFTTHGAWRVKTPEEVRMAIVDAVSEYGASVQLEVYEGRSTQESMEAMWKRAGDVAAQFRIFAGLFLDRPRNHLGATGWDFIRGRIMPKQRKD